FQHLLSRNPLKPAYAEPSQPESRTGPAARWIAFPAGVREVGHSPDGCHFDNEAPRHRVYLNAFQLATRPVSNRDYLAFVEDRGYRRPELWLSDGWDTCTTQHWDAPLY